MKSSFRRPRTRRCQSRVVAFELVRLSSGGASSPTDEFTARWLGFWWKEDVVIEAPAPRMGILAIGLGSGRTLRERQRELRSPVQPPPKARALPQGLRIAVGEILS
jgi:hypothetical protein